jgi:hypothetical protein
VDLRDKVYGLLGLLDDRAYENSDYEKRLQQVFDATIYFAIGSTIGVGDNTWDALNRLQRTMEKFRVETGASSFKARVLEWRSYQSLEEHLGEV